MFKKIKNLLNDESEVIEEKPLKASIIHFDKITLASDQVLLELADKLKENIPLIINFEDTISIDDQNKAIAFLSGVAYGVSGYAVQIQKKIMLFGALDLYDDGSMKQLLNEYEKEN